MSSKPMFRSAWIPLLPLVLLTGPAAAQERPAGIDELVLPLLEDEVTVGLVVGTLRGDDFWVGGYGRVSTADEAAPDGDTLYEIGSITKVFTGILLAEAVERGEVALDDPLAEYLPEDVRLEPHGETEIRLVDLATHASGLPRLPPDFRPGDPRDPYADYDADKLHASLGKIRLRRAPGEAYEYSNLAAGLLGHILCDEAGTSYEALVERRITGPLAMNDTRIRLDEDRTGRLAPPYDSRGGERSNWSFDALAGAGALRSTASDMLKFARANLHPGETRLEAALRLAQRIHFEGPKGRQSMGLGWHFADGGKTLWHNGGTGGYHSFLALRPENDVAVVVLANTTSDRTDELGMQVLALLREKAGD